MQENMKKRVERRVFSEEVKLELVRVIEKGESTVLEVSRIYSVSCTAVYKWLRKYSDLYKSNKRVIVESKSLSTKNLEQKKQIADLEKAVGQKQMRIDYLEKLLEVASERLGEDIEKKIGRLS